MRAIWRVGLGSMLLCAGFGAWLLAADEPAAPAKPRVTTRPAIRLVAPAVKPVAAKQEDEQPAAAKAATVVVEEEPTIKSGSEASATHEQIDAVEVKGEGGSTLQTLSAMPDGKIVGLVAPARHAAIGVAGKGPSPTEIRLFSSSGKESIRWTVPFTGQSIGVGPRGTIYVAGDGRLAKYDEEGKLLAEVEVPHLAEVLKDQDALKKKAEEQLKQEQASFLNSKKVYEQIVKQLEENKERSETEEQQLKVYKNYLDNFDANVAARSTRKIEDVIKQITSRLRTINGIAATEKDVYIACGELVGYGYAIWRMDADLTNPERVLGPVSGCCGQMDIQASGDHFYLSENTKKRVAQYDRTGKLVSAFGQSGRESDGLSFGGCCNPMNCRVCATGDILTAESEGIVKRFSATGEFLGLVGYARLTGGCKNVAVAASPKLDRVYFCDLPGSRIIILAAKKTEAAGE